MRKDGRKLPHELQTLVDNDDGFYDDLYSSSVDTTQTPYRYLAYTNRLRTIFLTAHRYIAYSSEVGESFRPVAHPVLVKSAYAVSWTYIAGDVLYEGYKAYLRNVQTIGHVGLDYNETSDKATSAEILPNAPIAEDGMRVFKGIVTGDIPWQVPLAEDYRLVMAKRATFQTLASMALPAFTIHSVVKYTGRMLRGSKSVLFRTWAPVGLGLAIIPALPYLFDEPVERAVEWGFEGALQAYTGQYTELSAPEQSTGYRSATTTTKSPTWEQYKAERHQARSEETEEPGEKGKGPLAMLGFGGFGAGKGKSD